MDATTFLHALSSLEFLHFSVETSEYLCIRPKLKTSSVRYFLNASGGPETGIYGTKIKKSYERRLLPVELHRGGNKGRQKQNEGVAGMRGCGEAGMRKG